MNYRTKEEMHQLLDSKQYLQEKLYVNGFVITDHFIKLNDQYPFYGNWKSIQLSDYHIYSHKSINLEVYDDLGVFFFLLGHAVDPFDKLSDDKSILLKLARAYKKGLSAYFEAQNDLTGIYCTGIINKQEIYVSNDCTGMQIIYYGIINGKNYFTSHSKLVADLLNLKQSQYIEKLVNSRFYHYMGTWLPGDLSPFPELTRLVPNHYIHISDESGIETVRFFPAEAISEIDNRDIYRDTIKWLSDALHNTLSLYSEKWSDKRVAVSVTGGRDSTTTLACANCLYDKFDYFSYISNESERVDAYAARTICEHLGLKHEIYEIPMDDSELPDTDIFAAVLECNSGCIGENNKNDVRKRLYFILNPKYDVEIKSWVNELGRGSQYTKYNKKSFPEKPTSSYCRALHKIYLSPELIHETDKVFDVYLHKYYPDEVLEKAPWMELFWWEFCWSGGEGIFLTAEHRTSSEIAIPFNNRRYIAKMLTVPLQKRVTDSIPKDIINLMNPKVSDSGIVVQNVKHDDKRAMLMRIYLEVFSRIHF